MAAFKYSSKGLALTRQFEGLCLEAYQDSVDVWTIGYGHTGPDVVHGLTITEEQAAILLAADVAWAATCVNKAVRAAINQNHFDALVDFTFNLGGPSFTGSTLLRLLNAGNYAAAAAQFLRWNKAGGKPLKGLTRRRQAEADLFNTPPPPPRTGITLKAAAKKKTARKPTKKATKKTAKKSHHQAREKIPSVKGALLSTSGDNQANCHPGPKHTG